MKTIVNIGTMTTLYIHEFCPSSRRNKKLRQIIRAAKKANYNRLRFLDTYIFLNPVRPDCKKKRRRTIFPLPKIKRTFYALLITNEDSYGYVDSPKVIKTEPC